MHTSFLHCLRHGAFLLLTALAVSVAACGGGGGGGSGSNNSSSTDTSSLPPAPSQQPIVAAAANTVTVSVGTGVANVPNIPTVSVTVCVPNGGPCTVVNNMQVDTASFGIRIVSSALSSILSTLPVNAASNGGALAECAAFADGFTWGTVRNVDVKIGGETASAIPIQVIGDLPASTVPGTCSVNGPQQSTASDLGANGILGIGVAPWDCGATCVNSATSTNYYSCPGGTNCNKTTVATSQQVANPVPHFPVDNNGIILQMQPLSYNGASSATGTLVFGINTQSNNTNTATQRFQTNSVGDFSATFNNRLVGTFLDSGSNALFFTDNSLPQCGGSLGTFYCPLSPQTFNAALTGADGSSGSATFSVVSAAALFGANGNKGNFAFNDLAGQFGSTSTLDLGLPFFYGRYVYVGQDMAATGGTQLPFVAF
ncbi:DUF3443 domain-containing protein [Paraburkholderia dinghuensis]|uniref:DUF3443 domain-containing protein n=1 Tax=Paraburkholderia dinghuensis TaxID=2305225 RepID=A0A3N6NB42_9BURK|nr:DUF3443 domain-containing protein [Paraburkholderia dinghuensis]